MQWVQTLQASLPFSIQTFTRNISKDCRARCSTNAHWQMASTCPIAPSCGPLCYHPSHYFCSWTNNTCPISQVPCLKNFLATPPHNTPISIAIPLNPLPSRLWATAPNPPFMCPTQTLQFLCTSPFQQNHLPTFPMRLHF